MIIIVLLVLGLCLGSFVNALVWRLREQSKSKAKVSKELSILHGRSMCVHCKHELKPVDLIPVVSWLWLGGLCRYCHKPISWQYPTVELLTALLFMLSYIFWPFILNDRGEILLVFWLALLVGLIALAVYDLRWYLLPDKIVYPLIWLGLLQGAVLLIFGPTGKELVALISAVAIGGGIFYVIFQLSQGKWIGGGDVKLGFLLGLILADGGLAVLTIFLASVLGSFVAIPLLATGKVKRTTRIPFGPFLIVAAIIARLFGASIIHWYKRKLLLMG